MKDLYQTSFIHLALMTLLACTNSEETGDSGQADSQQPSTQTLIPTQTTIKGVVHRAPIQ